MTCDTGRLLADFQGCLVLKVYSVIYMYIIGVYFISNVTSFVLTCFIVSGNDVCIFFDTLLQIEIVVVNPLDQR